MQFKPQIGDFLPSHISAEICAITRCNGTSWKMSSLTPNTFCSLFSLLVFVIHRVQFVVFRQNPKLLF